MCTKMWTAFATSCYMLNRIGLELCTKLRCLVTGRWTIFRQGFVLAETYQSEKYQFASQTEGSTLIISIKSKQPIPHGIGCFDLVRVTGLEPAWNCSHMDLNHARLPIPPYPRMIVSGLVEFKIRFTEFFKLSQPKVGSVLPYPRTIVNEQWLMPLQHQPLYHKVLGL